MPAKPEDGTRVTNVPPVKLVVVEVAAGSKVTVTSGTDNTKFALLIFCRVKRNVAGFEPRPLGLRTLLNQINESLLICAPLKFAVIEVES